MIPYDDSLGLKPLLSDDETDLFLIEIDDNVEFSMTFKVYEVTCWNTPESTEKGNYTPFELELYISGTIKWDGCSHLTFGEDGDGYLHLCGKYCWEQHYKMMKKLYELAENTITNFNKDIAN